MSLCRRKQAKRKPREEKKLRRRGKRDGMEDCTKLGGAIRRMAGTEIEGTVSNDQPEKVRGDQERGSGTAHLLDD